MITMPAWQQTCMYQSTVYWYEHVLYPFFIQFKFKYKKLIIWHICQSIKKTFFLKWSRSNVGACNYHFFLQFELFIRGLLRLLWFTRISGELIKFHRETITGQFCLSEDIELHALYINDFWIIYDVFLNMEIDNVNWSVVLYDSEIHNNRQMNCVFRFRLSLLS